MSYHQRRSKRLKGYNYCSSGIYFVTICTINNDKVLGQIVNERIILNKFGLIAQKEWIKTSQIRTYVQLDEFITMPDHIHGIIKILPAVGATPIKSGFSTGSVAHIENKNDHNNFDKITHIKFNLTAQKSLQPNSLGSIIGQYKSVVTKKIRNIGFGEFRWQRNYYDRIIRSKPELIAIRKYIRENPSNYRL